MKQTKLIMGMPITVEIVDSSVSPSDFKDVFSYFRRIDEQFSPYKKTSEVSKINRKELGEKDYSDQMREILALAEKTKKETNGYFDAYNNGYFDPSGIVKGYAIQKAAEQLEQIGFKNFYVDAGGDVQVKGVNAKSKKWQIGIRNPFEHGEIVKVISLGDEGIATSGTAVRGEHIYNPHTGSKTIKDIVSLTVIGPTVLEADRMATAAFAMGRQGISFIDSQPQLEGYMIDREGVATFTKGFEKYV